MRVSRDNRLLLRTDNSHRTLRRWWQRHRRRFPRSVDRSEAARAASAAGRNWPAGAPWPEEAHLRRGVREAGEETGPRRGLRRCPHKPGRPPLRREPLRLRTALRSAQEGAQVGARRGGEVQDPGSREAASNQQQQQPQGPRLLLHDQGEEGRRPADGGEVEAGRPRRRVGAPPVPGGSRDPQVEAAGEDSRGQAWRSGGRRGPAAAIRSSGGHGPEAGGGAARPAEGRGHQRAGPAIWRGMRARLDERQERPRRLRGPREGGDRHAPPGSRLALPQRRRVSTTRRSVWGRRRWRRRRVGFFGSEGRGGGDGQGPSEPVEEARRPGGGGGGFLGLAEPLEHPRHRRGGGTSAAGEEGSSGSSSGARADDPRLHWFRNPGGGGRLGEPHGLGRAVKTSKAPPTPQKSRHCRCCPLCSS